MKFATSTVALLLLLLGCDSVTNAERHVSPYLEVARTEMLSNGIDAPTVNAVINHFAEVEGLRSLNVVIASQIKKDASASKTSSIWEYDTGSISTPLCCGVYRFRLDMDTAVIATNAYTQGDPMDAQHQYGIPNYARTAIYGGGNQLDVASEEHWIRADVDASGSKSTYTSFCAVSNHYMPAGDGGQAFGDGFTYCWNE